MVVLRFTLNIRFKPVSAEEAELVKVFWDDGGISFLTKAPSE
jgi:hypothetical protein